MERARAHRHSENVPTSDAYPLHSRTVSPVVRHALAQLARLRADRQAALACLTTYVLIKDDSTRPRIDDARQKLAQADHELNQAWATIVAAKQSAHAKVSRTLAAAQEAQARWNEARKRASPPAADTRKAVDAAQDRWLQANQEAISAHFELRDLELLESLRDLGDK